MDWHLRSLFVETIQATETSLRETFNYAKSYACTQLAESSNPKMLMDYPLIDKAHRKKTQTYQYINDICFEKFVYRRHPIGAGRMTRGRKIPFDKLRQDFHELSDEKLLELFTMRVFRSYFQIATPEFRSGVGKNLKLPNSVAANTLAGLSALKSACVREEPIWNWKAGHYRPLIRFPHHLRSPSGLAEGDNDKIYSYCVMAHYVLTRLRRDPKQFYRKLVAILELVDNQFHRRMGFPKNWSSRPYWAELGAT